MSGFPGRWSVQPHTTDNFHFSPVWMYMERGWGGGHKTKIKGFLNCLTKWLSRKLSLTVSWLESTLPACLVMRKLIIALGGWSQLLNIGPDLCVCLGYHCNIYFSEGCS